jgi:hypothetical protein
LLLNPAFGQLFKNVPAPLNSSYRDSLTQDRKIERLHLDGHRLTESFSNEKRDSSAGLLMFDGPSRTGG